MGQERRHFTDEFKRPDQVWLADITYTSTGEGSLYLAVILDLFTRKVVGWAMRDHMRAERPSPRMAIQRRRPAADLIRIAAGARRGEAD